MKNYKLFLSAFICLPFYNLNGQNIQFTDLHGKWILDTGKSGNSLYLNFISEYYYNYSSERDTTIKKDYYELISKEPESVLTLYRNTGSYLASRNIYLVRKIDSVSFQLQVPESDLLGEIISYKWLDKNNTYFLHRNKMEIK
jgi:hypothetical protein